MIRELVKGKTAIFIDASNIYFSQKTLKWHIDFVRLLEYLKNETDFWKAFFYTAYDPNHKKQKEFLDFLEIVGYSVRTKFEALIKYLKRYWKRCIVFSVKGHVSLELVKQAKFIDLKKLAKYIKRK